MSFCHGKKGEEAPERSPAERNREGAYPAGRGHRPESEADAYSPAETKGARRVESDCDVSPRQWPDPKADALALEGVQPHERRYNKAKKCMGGCFFPGSVIADVDRFVAHICRVKRSKVHYWYMYLSSNLNQPQQGLRPIVSLHIAFYRPHPPEKRVIQR